jgi:hypothetical protein
MVYGATAGATLNIQKSNILFVGQRNRTDRPLCFQWSKQGGKYLDIYLGNTNGWQQQNWTQLDIKAQAILQQWEKGPQATSYHERKQILNQLIGAKLMHILTILHPTTIFLKTMHKLMVSFIWQGRHWKHHNFVYGMPEDGGIGVHHLPTRINTLRFILLHKFIARNDRENAWQFQAHNIRTYAPALHALDVLKLNLNPTCFPVMTTFYASTLKA